MELTSVVRIVTIIFSGAMLAVYWLAWRAEDGNVQGASD